MKRSLSRSIALAAPLLLAAAPLLSSACVAPVFGVDCLAAEEGKAPDASCGSFVKPGATGGDGSPDRPYGTIAEALTAGAKVVYVCEGIAADTSVSIPGGTQLIGGLDCDSWEFKLDARTTIKGEPGAIPVRLLSGGPIVIEGMRVEAVDATQPGGSSTAVLAEQADVAFRRVNFLSGKATDGAPGAAGATGAEGQVGFNATGAAGAAGGASTCGADGGDGGDGTNGAKPGDPGMPEQDNGGLANCMPGGTGTEGKTGRPGDHGLDGTLGPDGYVPSTAGDGQPGTPGGGGGGGGSKPDDGGGGGGAGGCPGGPGTGAGSGGSSITIISLSSKLTFEGCEAVVGEAGNGAMGGPGGSGGAGQGPGQGNQTGCDGGAGGKGGDGGPGGNGAGGHALAVAYTGEPPTLDGLSVHLPQAAGEGPGDAPDGSVLTLLELGASE